jgi:hypothetical protein
MMTHVLDLLLPSARNDFANLARDLRRHTRFRPNTGYRSPTDQEAAFKRGASKAHAFESAHQFGLAVDFVPWDGTKFVWPERSNREWDQLRARAKVWGLVNDIEWDRPHVEHRLWARVRALTR